MVDILVGAAVLIAVLVLLTAFVNANPRTLMRAVRYAGAAALLLVAAGLVYARFIVFGLFVGSLAWGLFFNGSFRPQGNFGFMPWGIAYRTASRRRPRRGPQAGQTSRVATPWVDIELNHDTGEMQGQVLQGKQSGKALSALSPDQLVTLYGEAGADVETARLLEAYLDRRLGPEWRLKQQQEKPSEEPSHRSRRDSGMSREEAFRVLGIAAGANETEIRAAHKRLMMQNHPDRGGTDYLAAKINEAKDVLLG